MEHNLNNIEELFSILYDKNGKQKAKVVNYKAEPFKETDLSDVIETMVTITIEPVGPKDRCVLGKVFKRDLDESVELSEEDSVD